MAAGENLLHKPQSTLCGLPHKAVTRLRRNLRVPRTSRKGRATAAELGEARLKARAAIGA
jgi:hypothetical protein